MSKFTTAKSRLKKVLCFALVILLAASTFACQQAEPTKAAVATTKAADATADVAVTEPPTNKPVEIEVFLNHTWYPTDKFEGVIPQAITEKTNVVFKPTRAADDKQLGLMIASDDLPEMIFTQTELSRLSDSKFSYSYNELITKYLPSWTPDSMSIVNSSSYALDGNYYFLFSHGFSAAEWASAKTGVPMTSSLQYRADIADKVGMTIDKINTLDDIDTLFSKVKAQYPEMNVFSMDPTWTFSYWLVQMGVNAHTDWNEVDGKYVHKIEYAKYEDYLHKINDYYRKGYINPDSFAYVSADAAAALTSGNTFAQCGGTQGFAFTYTNMAQKADPTAKILELKPVNDKAIYRMPGLGWCGTFITKKCKNPDAAINAMNYLLSPEGGRLSMWGREGVEYTLDNNGIPKFSQEWTDAQKDSTLFNSKYNTQFYFGATALIEGIGRTAHLGAEYQDVYTAIRNKVVVEPWYTLAMPKDAESDEYIINTKLVDLIKNQETKIIQSKDAAEFTANLKELKDNAKQIGIDKLTTYMNQKIPEAKIKY